MRWLVTALMCIWCAALRADPPMLYDAVGEVQVRRTDAGANNNLDSPPHARPDIVAYQTGNWAPANAAKSLFVGAWTPQGLFLRVDIFFVGLLNPPGSLSLFGDTYEPFRHGPNPVFGYIEFDIDSNTMTGGEVAATEHRYLANATRFGGKPPVPRYMNRFAIEGIHLDGIVSTPPFVERSGEEFHIALVGDWIQQVFEVLGNGDSTFGADETWIVRGELFHRAHVFESFSNAGGDGVYQPVVDLLWEHDSNANLTRISLVYPLINAASADAIGLPPNGVEPTDGDDGNQNSIEEALADLVGSVQAIPVADPRRLQPSFPMIAGWEYETPDDYLVSEIWDKTLLVGMAYPIPDPSGALFAWTDCAPGARMGDFNADEAITSADANLLNGYIAQKDGTVRDADGIVNGVVHLPNFGENFCLYDLNYDGIVGPQDKQMVLVPGDIDIDFDVDEDDLVFFIQAALMPTGTMPGQPANMSVLRADFNGNGRIDGDDVQEFTWALLSSP